MIKPGENIRLYAISMDTSEDSRKFIQKISSDGKGSTDFEFLSDPDHRVIDSYGIRDASYNGQQFEGLPRPSVYIVDSSGRVSWATVEEDYKQRPTNDEVRAALTAVR